MCIDVLLWILFVILTLSMIVSAKGIEDLAEEKNLLSAGQVFLYRKKVQVYKFPTRR